MGSLVGALTGGGNNAGFKAQTANVVTPTTADQANTAYTGNQDALTQQQNLLQALQGQNGIQNQSNVYNQLQGVANGTGPNPAQAMLANTTGQNTANQAALMAGQRGSSQNAGLIARQAAMQGAANQQNAAGQGAALQANQSLNALGQMGSLANTQAGQQIGATTANTAAQQTEQNQLLNSINAQNTAGVSNASQANTANAAIAAQNAKAQAGGLSSLLSAAGTVGGMMFGGPLGAAAGGALGGMLGGAGTSTAGGAGDATQTSGNAGASAMMGDGPTMMAAEGGKVSGPSSMVGKHFCSGGAMMAKGGKVPALVSPGERYLSPKEVEKVAEGKKSPMKAGEKIPGKPKFKGNDYRNDTVPKTLDEGGIVLPNKIMQSKHPHWEAHKFVSAILAKEGRMPTKSPKKKD